MRMWSNWNSQLLLEGMPKGRATWKTVWQCLTKLKVCFPQQPGIPLASIYPRVIKTEVHTKRVRECSKQRIHPIPKGNNPMTFSCWMGQTVCTHTMGHYLALQKNDLVTCGKTRGNLSHYVRSKKSNTEDQKWMIHFIWPCRKGKAIVTKKKWAEGLTAKGQERTSWGKGIVLCLGCVMVA